MSRQRKTEDEQCSNTEEHRPHTWRKPVGKKGWHLQRCIGIYVFHGVIVEDATVKYPGRDDGVRGESAHYVVTDEAIHHFDHAYSQRGGQLERILRNADWLRTMGSLY